MLCVGIILALRCSAMAQGPARSSQAVTTHEAIERGYLSSTAYTNSFFGFKLPIPTGVELQELRTRRDLPQGERFLFGLHSVQGGVTGFVITAVRSGRTSAENAKTIAGRTAGSAAPNLEKKTIDGRDFWIGSHSERTSDGLLSRASYAVALNGYIVEFYLSSRNQEVFARLCKAIEALQFFDPAMAKEIAGGDSVAFPRE